MQELIWDHSSVEDQEFTWKLYGTLYYNNGDYNICDDPFYPPALRLQGSPEPRGLSCTFSKGEEADTGFVNAEFSLD